MKRSFSLLLYGLLMIGCSTTIQVGLTGQSDMNGGGNAAVVQVYELSGQGNFLDASFRSFWQDEGAIASVLVRSPRRETLYPDETKNFELELAENTKFIGVAANLRNPEQDTWRALYPVEEVGDHLSVTVQGNSISVTVEGAGPLQRIGI